MRYSDGLKTIEHSTQSKGVALCAGADVCLVYICVCVCVCVWSLLHSWNRVYWIGVSLQENTHSQISALSHDIRASPAQKQQVHHSGAPAGEQQPPLCVQNIISVDCDILFLLMCLLFWRTNTHPTSLPTGEGWLSPCQWL